MRTLKSTGLCLDVRTAPSNVFVDTSRYSFSVTNTNVVTSRGFGSSLAGNFDGSSSYLDIGDIENDIKSVEIWLKPTSVSVTEEVIDLNGTAYIKITDGVVSAEGFASPTIYTNGVKASSITMGWNHIIATTSTSIDASDVDIGRLEGSTYFNGLIFISRVYNYTLPYYRVLNNYYEYAEYLGLE